MMDGKKRRFLHEYAHVEYQIDEQRSATGYHDKIDELRAQEYPQIGRGASNSALF